MNSCTSGVKDVVCGEISYSRAPFSSATSGRLAAGCTVPEVPTMTRVSHACNSSTARFQAFSGSASPNHVTSGRIKFPHKGHVGGVSRSTGSDHSGNV